MESQNKNLIIATVLSVLVLLGWTYFMPPTKPTPTETAATSEQTAAPAGTTAPTPLDAVTTEAATEQAVAAAPRVRIETPSVTGSISLVGGRLDDLSLRKYNETLAANSPLVRLLAPVGGDNLGAAKPYYAVYGWSPAGGLDPALVPGPKTVWTAPADAVLTPTTPVTLSWDNGAGLKFTRTISVDDKYLFTVAQGVENTTAAPVRLAPYGIVVRHGIPDSPRVYVLHEGAIRMTDGKL
ncbi:MAG TPA: membrane protein insertase YidC, partial [Paenirhodobacter sp.]